MKKSFKKAIDFAVPGPHVFLYLHPVGTRWTTQDDGVIKEAGRLFGKDLMHYLIVVFTRSDDLDVSECEYLEHSLLADIKKKIKRRFFFIENKNRTEEQKEKLLRTCVELSEENSYQRYTSDLFEKANKEEQDRLHKEQMEKDERQQREKERYLKENNSYGYGGLALLAAGVAGGVVGGAALVYFWPVVSAKPICVMVTKVVAKAGVIAA